MGATFQSLAEPIPISQQYWPDETVPAVSICCITYNHSDFIREAIDGFLMQETTFPVEILIHDDASADGTAEIVREYEERHPRLIRGILQEENQYSLGRRPGWMTRAEARGRYIAFCEGDDYWTDCRKLQMQYDLLEADPDAVVAFHDVSRSHGDGGEDEKPHVGPVCSRGEIELVPAERVAKGYHIPTLSILYRNSLELQEAWPPPGIVHGDRYLFALLFNRGHGIRIHRNMGVYRLHAGGVWSGASRSEQLINRIKVRMVVAEVVRPELRYLVCIELCHSALKGGGHAVRYRKPRLMRYCVIGILKSLWGVARSLIRGDGSRTVIVRRLSGIVFRRKNLVRMTRVYRRSVLKPEQR